ncbi:aspartate carbamoyltransferase [Granulicella mallensis]|jgi:aspartate carbamoyltransferase catalytic subunit|uniref:Aspartate carbamoyltransferase n=2 Tax=Granulicella mallensis TaxID=940614 RepID=G8NQ50_GRAMM|nr:aspartate carbamoyltransferase [Granulicella mallensis]AEU34906.1 aspartate carbamoyltransferase [Granulicella mallensis MP5ACTX8]MBB5065571.1 aspartate carbamoyltransferase catalytic subunit [Granulicella mallensis]
MQKLKHIISTTQLLNRPLQEHLFASAAQMERDDAQRTLARPLSGRILATIFYEPSTRTRLSFEAAMQKLGGGVLTVENARDSSSATKGESIADSIRVISGYADVIALRHFEEGTAKIAAKMSPVPLINAGDGIGEHPTQALADIYTIEKELGGREGLRVALVGDLLYGRTIHSLLPLLCLYPGVQIDLVSPAQLRLPAKYIQHLERKGVNFRESDKLGASIKSADVIYVTRVQKERFESPQEYEAIKDVYLIDSKIADKLKRHAIIMHALPRVNEIAPEVDSNSRAAYFRQAKNALYIRMALLNYLLA